MSNRTRNFRNEDLNPCLEESNLSYGCLDKYAFDHEKCSLYFANYRECKKFWGNIARQRLRAGISPSMPTAEERAKILDKRKVDKNCIQAELI